MTEAVSRSMSSGATSDPRRRRARATSPCASSSASAATRTLASTTITIFVQRLDGVAERQRSARPPAGSVEDLIQRRPTRLLDQPTSKVLLQRLPSRGSALTKHRVRLFGHVLDLYAGYGAILAPQAPVCKRWYRSSSTEPPRRRDALAAAATARPAQPASAAASGCASAPTRAR